MREPRFAGAARHDHHGRFGDLRRRIHAVIAAFYGGGPKFSYWNGCSSGGKQGLKEAQRFPDDFNGIVAGAPANDMIHLDHEAPAVQAPARRSCSRRASGRT